MDNKGRPLPLYFQQEIGFLGRVVSWSSECLLPCLPGNGLDNAWVCRHLHSADTSISPFHRHRSTTKAVAVDAELCLNAFAMPRVSDRRSAGASDLYDSVHEGEWVRHGGRLPESAAMHMARCAAISRVVRIEDAHRPATHHDKPHGASCHPTPSEVDLD